MWHIKLPFKHLQLIGRSRERPIENMVIHPDLTSGSGIWENTDDNPWNSSTAPQPRSRSWGGHTGWTPTIVPLFLLRSACSLLPLLPPLSLCLASCLQWCHVQDHNDREWLTVTGVLMPSFLPHLSAHLYLCLVLLSQSHNTTGSQRHASGHTAGRSKLPLYDSHTAVRVHQLINRAGVVYSQLILLGTGS